MNIHLLRGVFSGLIADLGGYAQGSIILGGAADWETLVHPGAAGHALVSDATSIVWDQTPLWKGQHSFEVGVAFVGASGANEITIPDNAAIALEVLDTGGLEYLRINSADANPYFLIDPAATAIKVIIGGTVPGAKFQVNTNDAAVIGQIIKGHAGQTANLQEWQDNLANVLASIAGGNSTTFFQINQADATNVLTVDTVNGKLTINQTADSGALFELLAKSGSGSWKLTDDGGPAGSFSPSFWFNAVGSTTQRNRIFATVLPEEDLGVTPVVEFDSRQNDNTSIVTRPIFAISNRGAVKLIVLANGNIGAECTPATSAKLELSSTVGALLLTRMTTVQRDALTAVNGMVLYNTTNNRLEAYENGAWVDL